VFYSDLANTILEVRELFQDGVYYAFLQMRTPITVYSRPEMHVLPTQNVGLWQLVASGYAEEEQPIDLNRSPRLDALKNLQLEIEKQGSLKKIWDRWEGSRRLVLDRP